MRPWRARPKQLLGSTDGPLPDRLIAPALAQLDGIDLAQLPATRAMLAESLGTIGGGNHFAELQIVDTVYDEAADIDKKRVHLLVHSGSRGLGEAILRTHVEQFGHAGLEAQSLAAASTWRSTKRPRPLPGSTATGSPAACCRRCAHRRSFCSV